MHKSCQCPSPHYLDHQRVRILTSFFGLEVGVLPVPWSVSLDSGFALGDERDKSMMTQMKLMSPKRKYFLDVYWLVGEVEVWGVYFVGSLANCRLY